MLEFFVDVISSVDRSQQETSIRPFYFLGIRDGLTLFLVFHVLQVCRKCGLLGYYNHKLKTSYCSMCKNGENMAKMRMPYACKLLFQVLQKGEVKIALLIMQLDCFAEISKNYNAHLVKGSSVCLIFCCSTLFLCARLPIVRSFFSRNCKQ